ncbi:MAG: hypothetical protein R3F62_31355 [Planctomycetota bacterium]
MTDPRRVLHGQIHMVSARCSERRFFLKPCKAVREIFVYALARALEQTSVELYAVTVQANHFHAQVGDPKGELPKFMELLDLLTARGLNAHWGRGERFWSSAPYSNVEIHDEETLVRELVYLFTNPVKDGLVARPEEWPGFSTSPEDVGTRTFVAERPDYAFFGGKRAERWIAKGSMTPAEYRKAVAEREQAEARDREDGRRVREPRSTLPDAIPFEVKVPFMIPPAEHEAFRKKVRAAVELEVDEIHRRRRAEGKPVFMGAAKIRALNWRDSTGDTFPSFGLNPRIASGNQDGEREELLRGLVAWREAYREALAAWQDDRDYEVEFPLGTYGKHKVDKCNLATEPILRA